MTGNLVVTCPARPPAGRGPVVFLAGGISGCRNWQAEAPALLPAGTVVCNPRRPDWTIGDDTESPAQIAWEVEYMRAAAVTGVTLFWFSHETPQPITWYELGITAAFGRRMAVGCDPLFPRRLDVQLQLGHVRPDVTVRDSLPEVCADVAVLLGHLRRDC